MTTSLPHYADLQSSHLHPFAFLTICMPAHEIPDTLPALSNPWRTTAAPQILIFYLRFLDRTHFTQAQHKHVHCLFTWSVFNQLQVKPDAPLLALLRLNNLITTTKQSGFSLLTFAIFFWNLPPWTAYYNYFFSMSYTATLTNSHSKIKKKLMLLWCNTSFKFQPVVINKGFHARVTHRKHISIVQQFNDLENKLLFLIIM